MLDPGIANEIIGAWMATARVQNRTDMAQSVPRHGDLLALLEVAFLASIEREERAHIRPRLVFFPGARAADLPTHAGDVFPFENPVPFSVAGLAKLAPAFDQDSSALVVAKQGDRYVMVGAVFYGRVLTRLETGQTSWARPYALSISVRGPGSVVIAFGDSAVGRYDRGDFVRAVASPLDSPPLRDHLIRTISTHAAYRDHRAAYWALYRECLERLYLSASRQGHGGTIVWCPSRQLDAVAASVRAGTRVRGRTAGHRLADTVLQQRARASVDPDLGPVIADSLRRLAAFLDFAARLAIVDGALVVDDEIAVRHFGAHLAAEPRRHRVVEGATPWTDLKLPEPFDVSRFGTRHASALGLVGEHPGVVAFVISEDGPIRTMVRLEDTVVIWPDARNTVFAD